MTMTTDRTEDGARVDEEPAAEIPIAPPDYATISKPLPLGRRATTVGAEIRMDPMFSHDVDGHVVERRARCECGRVFRQVLLSERFLTIVERQGPHAVERFMRQVPQMYVPVFCPRCERADIKRQAMIDNYRAVQDAAPPPQPSFGERESDFDPTDAYDVDDGDTTA